MGIIMGNILKPEVCRHVRPHVGWTCEEKAPGWLARIGVSASQCASNNAGLKKFANGWESGILWGVFAAVNAV